MTWHKDKWSSSEEYDGLFTNNVQAASSTLLSGNNYSKLQLFAKFLGLGFVSESTYYRIQRLYCLPAIEEWWDWMSCSILAELKDKDTILCGDGQCDSPGHCKISMLLLNGYNEQSCCSC